jgi:hypothetical protein
MQDASPQIEILNTACIKIAMQSKVSAMCSCVNLWGKAIRSPIAAVLGWSSLLGTGDVNQFDSFLPPCLITFLMVVIPTGYKDSGTPIRHFEFSLNKPIRGCRALRAHRQMQRPPWPSSKPFCHLDSAIS